MVHAGVTLSRATRFEPSWVRAPLPAELAELRARYGLDQPYPVQYLAYLTQLMQGNLGLTISFTPQRVSTVIGAALPTTVY